MHRPYEDARRLGTITVWFHIQEVLVSRSIEFKVLLLFI